MRDDLGPDARALLDAARDGFGPDPAAIARMRGKIGLAVGGGAAATAAGAGTSLAVKLTLLGAVIATVVGAGLYARSSSDDIVAEVAAAPPAIAPPSAAASISAAAPPSMAPPAEAPPSAPSHEPVVDSSRIEIEPPTPAPVVRRAPVAEPAPATVAPVTPARSLEPTAGLAREVELIDSAMSALRKKDYAAALAAARLHAAETRGRGQLAEDAAAIEIEALCRQHVSVFDKLEAFDARWPASAQRSRLTSTCR
ncbi:MAG: hypothetical protein KIT31_34085 [Deltaproteobacteria bacterium]|nr:hypothetical protein [Deltaproteobacteria bacterium]